MARRNKALALLIATDEYTDATFQQLRSPPADVEALAAVLANPAIGGYEVRTLHNPEAHEARLAIEDLFADVGRNDLVLLYISGHGVKDDEGLLHFAMTNSRHNRLSSTAIDSQFVRNRMHFSRSRRIVVCLDCCYAGAFPAGATHRAADSAGVLAKLAGKGPAVMTSSSALEYSYEAGDATSAKVTGTASPSVFTGSLVQGLRTGIADRNRDGLVDVDELYEYVHDQIKAAGTKQTPGLNSDVEGRLFVAINPAGPATSNPKAPPSDYRAEDAIPVSRLAAVIRQPWKRPRWSSIPGQLVLHLVRPTTPDVLNDQLAAHLGDTVPHVLVSAPEPVAAGETALSEDLLELLDKSARAFVQHDGGSPRRFRFQRYELLTWLLKQKRSRLLKPENTRDFVDLTGGGTPVAQRWLLRQPYLRSSKPIELGPFAQRLLAAVHKNAEVVHKLLVHAFLTDLAEGYGRQPLWARWARRDYYPTLLLQRLTTGTTSAEFVRLVGEVRNETGTPDPLLIIATGPAVLRERHQDHDAAGSEQDERRAGRPRSHQRYVPVLVADQPRLAATDQAGMEAGVQAWTGHVRRPRVRSFLVRNHHLLGFVQALEASFALLVLAALATIAGSAIDSPAPSPADSDISLMMSRINDNNTEVRRNPQHITMTYYYESSKELPWVIRAQEESIEATVPIEVIVKEKAASPGNR